LLFSGTVTSVRALALLLVVGCAACAPARRGAASSPLFARTPHAYGLSQAELAALAAGRTVSRPMQLEQRGARYVGGISYALVRAAPANVFSALEDVRTLPEMLPATLSARRIGGAGTPARVDLVQGTNLVRAEYTIEVEAARAKPELEFWLDPNRPHDIDDVWGFIRVEPFDEARSLVTVAVLLDMGPGLGRLLFEGRIQRMILRTPGHIRDFIENRALALR
jgi:Polyketide cyclase / dehydrase and lipid transport